MTSPEIRRKLALVIANLIRRCIHEARLIPHVLTQEELVNILVADPAMFEKLVTEEFAVADKYSKEDLTIKLDAFSELGRLDSLASFDSPFWGEVEIDISPILDLVNRLTRTFAVYLGNASTIFDKLFEEFMSKFRRFLQRAGLALKAIDFTSEDVMILKESAAAYLARSEFLQAFTFDRLLDSQVMIEQLVRLPAGGYRLRQELIEQGLSDANLAPALARFILRISYVSQGAWDDLFTQLVRIVHRQPWLLAPQQLIDLIEQDVVFLCNLLRVSYADLRRWSPAQRRSAIESGIERYRAEA